MADCYYDNSGCLVCPEVDAKPAVPGYYVSRPVVGWSAGANTVKQLDGDVHAVFSLPGGTAGAAIGFKTSRTRQVVPDLVLFGFYFQSVGGADVVQVIESGVMKTSPVLRAGTDTFEVRRIIGNVEYLITKTLVYTSTLKSVGSIVLNACLYASGDEIN